MDNHDTSDTTNESPNDTAFTDTSPTDTGADGVGTEDSGAEDGDGTETLGEPGVRREIIPVHPLAPRAPVERA